MFADMDIVDPYLAIHIYFGVAVFHVAAALLFWFVYTQNGLLM